jgi:uncharacterized protein YprB with RNaseH-like and TPR domain
LAEVRGGDRLAHALTASPAVLAPFHPDFRLEQVSSFADAAFVDTETTGLGAGAGVYAFLVGVGAFETWPPDATPRPSPFILPSLADDRGSDDNTAPRPSPLAPTHFVVRQFFMRHPGEEAAVLAAVAEAVGTRRMVVTFNGRGFDLPLLRARYRQNRPLLPADYRSVALFEEGSPHLDLLQPARRLWRRRLQSCRLINLEQHILGLVRGEEDVPGAEIPRMYIDFLRTQQAGEMRRVFYHNREDIVSMVALGSELVRAYADSFTELEGVHAEDLLSLAACYVRQGQALLAERAYRSAATMAEDDRLRADVFAQWALLLKRQERWTEAADLWQLWLTSVPGSDALPFIELAKYHEWRTGDLAEAEMWAAWGLHTVEATPASQRQPGQLVDLRHRLERIRRKRSNGSQGDERTQ